MFCIEVKSTSNRNDGSVITAPTALCPQTLRLFIPVTLSLPPRQEILKVLGTENIPTLPRGVMFICSSLPPFAPHDPVNLHLCPEMTAFAALPPVASGFPSVREGPRRGCDCSSCLSAPPESLLPYALL